MKSFLLPVAVLLFAGAALTGCDDKKDKKDETPAVPVAPPTPPPVAIPVH